MVKIDGKAVVLPTGTRFGISMIHGDKATPLELVGMGKDRVAALFTEENADFCIYVDNAGSQHGVQFKITINQRSHIFCTSGRDKLWSIKALKTAGRKLHFLSQDTDEGKLLVGQTAAKYGMTLDEAAKMCCQIKFEIEVEKLLVQRPHRLSIGKEVQIFVKNLIGATLSYMIDLEDTIEWLKYLIFTKEKIPPKLQRLLYSGKELNDQNSKLSENKISADSTLHLLLSLKGGRGCPDDPSESKETITSQINIGSRGVACFGDKSDQVFGVADEFDEDENYKVEPFTVELRMISQYAPI